MDEDGKRTWQVRPTQRGNAWSAPATFRDVERVAGGLLWVRGEVLVYDGMPALTLGPLVVNGGHGVATASLSATAEQVPGALYDARRRYPNVNGLIGLDDYLAEALLCPQASPGSMCGDTGMRISIRGHVRRYFGSEP